MFKISAFRKCRARMGRHVLEIKAPSIFYISNILPQHVAFASWSLLATQAPAIQSSFLERRVKERHAPIPSSSCKEVGSHCSVLPVSKKLNWLKINNSSWICKTGEETGKTTAPSIANADGELWFTQAEMKEQKVMWEPGLGVRKSEV